MRNSQVRVCDANFEEASLDEEVPYTACLVDVNLDEVSGLAPAEFPAPSRVLAHEGLLDDKIRLRLNAQL